MTIHPPRRTETLFIDYMNMLFAILYVSTYIINDSQSPTEFVLKSL